MCGISGIIGPIAAEALLKQLLDPIAHRGELRYRHETLIRSGLAIGTHRLAIVDELSGKQPVQDNHRRAFCVFNGEIYNHATLRHELASYHSFVSKCDSEVVLQAYLHWGDEFIKYLDGKFAIFIFDEAKNISILARDPMGVKPLYYAKHRESWLFSSELKSFLSLKDSNLEILEIEPGSIWKNGEVKKYFTLEKFSRTSSNDSLLAMQPTLKNHLFKAVAKRIPKEAARIACLLSGGIDSSVITYLASQIHPHVTAYTLAAPHMPSADLHAAKTLSQHCNIEHVVVSPAVQEMQKLYLEEGVYMTESFEPVLVRNAVSYHFVCRQIAKDGFKYCLNGEGADELFGGYDFVREAPADRQDDVIWHSLSIIHKTYLQMADRASMYATLEARVPYLDKDLIAFCLSLPPEGRISGDKNKVILRQTFKGELPDSIINRRKTGMNEGAGFGVNATKESIYYKAVETYYQEHPNQFDEDLALCKTVKRPTQIDLTDIEELYNFAKFIRLKYTQLKGSLMKLQLNTRLRRELQN